MYQTLHRFILNISICLLLYIQCAQAQTSTAIATYAISNPTVCQGSTFKVWFAWTGTFATNNVFTVQVSDGGDFKNLVTGTPLYDANSRLYTVTVTLPSSYAAGASYRYRVVSSNPAVISTPVNPAQFAVKLTPAPPKVDSVYTVCPGVWGSTAGTWWTITMTPAANGQINTSLEYDYGQISNGNVTFYVRKSGASTPPYKYPYDERPFTSSQIVDGCESLPVSSKIRVLYGDVARPLVANQYDAQYGRLSYCLGEQTQPLNVNGHPMPPDYYKVQYGSTTSSSFSYTFTDQAPTPSTSVIGRTTYALRYVAKDPTKTCTPYAGISYDVNTYLHVDVLARPVKPLVSPTSVTVCQGATAAPLSATSIDAGASLSWYGTDATGGTASATAPRPATDRVGTFKYYVAQKLSGCDGERAEITVVIKPRPALPTVASSVSFCSQPCLTPGSCTYELGGNAVIGGKLLWYTTPTGGQPARDYNGASRLTSITIFHNQIAATYYVAQEVDGCESERAIMNVEIVQRPPSMFAATNYYNFNDFALCQAQGSVPLSRFHGPVPDGFTIYYSTSPLGGGSADVPVIDLSKAGRTDYYTTYVNARGCSTFIKATDDQIGRTVVALIKPAPNKPTTTSTSVCQYENAASLNATLVGDNNILRWYGTDATGGTPSTLAPRPATDKSGTLKYYVTQLSNLNNCESERAELAVEVKPASPAPTINGVTYCAGAGATPLSAVATSGGVLSWYVNASGGTGSAAAPTPNTNNAGAQTYYVTQSVGGGCESQRIPLTVTINPIPGAPSPNVPPAYCQFASATDLTAMGDNLKWYEAATGGAGAPTLKPATTDAGSKTYYVTQTVNTCESARSSVAVIVKPQPAAPTTTTPGTICQFAPQLTFSASGQNLVWYNVDDSPVGSVPLITTQTGRTLTYKVTQTVDGCTSAKASINVTVQTTPLPVLSRSVVEVCQGATASPLEATGTNLRWTDPTGLTTATAPTPPTLNATKDPDGDPFYVTQTGSNGCESPKATIRVFVQTVPMLSLSGSNTINLGLETPLRLVFTGVGPYSYSLTNGLSGIVTKDTSVLVMPAQTTLYQVSRVQNRCGVGLPGNGGIVTVTVLVPRIQTLDLTSSTLCAGQAISANFATSGTFNPGSVFKMQLAKAQGDTSAAQFSDLGNLLTNGTQISGMLSNTLAGGTYWVRVMATNPRIPVIGSISPTLLTVRTQPTASLSGTTRIYETQTASINIAFTGDAPWRVVLRDSSLATGTVGSPQTINTSANPHTLEVKPAKSTAYSISSVSNNCGNGPRLVSPFIIMVDPLLATQEDFSVTVFPVPTTTSIRMTVKGVAMNAPATITVSDLTGRLIHQQQTTTESVLIPMTNEQSGMYIVQVQLDKRIVSRRIVKL